MYIYRTIKSGTANYHYVNICIHGSNLHIMIIFAIGHPEAHTLASGTSHLHKRADICDRMRLATSRVDCSDTITISTVTTSPHLHYKTAFVPMSARMTAVTPTQSRSLLQVIILKRQKRKMPAAPEDGYETYWKCNTCKKLFSDEAGTVEISNPTTIKATGHNLEKVEKKDAGCTRRWTRNLLEV